MIERSGDGGGWFKGLALRIKELCGIFFNFVESFDRRTAPLSSREGGGVRGVRPLRK